MCGILFFSLTTKKIRRKQILSANQKISKRGPDIDSFKNVGEKKWFGFNRLSINDLSENGNQPFTYSNITAVCNGEIYNHKELKRDYNIQTKSDSDCEILPHLFKQINHDTIPRVLDGVFACIIYEEFTDRIMVFRDPIGVRPLFYQMDHEFNLTFASEAKCLLRTNIGEIKQVPAGSYMIFDNKKRSMSITKYFNLPEKPVKMVLDENLILTNIHSKLSNAVSKRLLSDRKIGCFLSGGLDSSIVASILAKMYSKMGKKIKTFSIGFEGSPDIYNARKVADFIGSEHHEFIITYEEALKYIERVIYHTETFDITTIRASVPMYILSEKVSKNFEERVIFSGEGADELNAGYLYFHDTTSNHRVFNESKRLVEELPFFDVLRADRCTATHGLELRVPFLDKEYLTYTMGLRGKIRKPKDNIEKYYLRKAFRGFIPDEVLWRRKDGFSDGVGGLEKGWPDHLQEYIETQVNYTLDKHTLRKYMSKEGYFYRMIYLKYYKDLNHIPHYWMPKWQDQKLKDPSGRKIKAFTSKSKIE